MNWIDHVLRERVFAGTAIVTLSTGTEMDLYPVSNLYNGRPGIPFRTEDTSFVLDFDFGVSPPTISHILLLASNLENLPADQIRWGSGAAFPPALTKNMSIWRAASLENDWIDSVMLPTVWMIANSTADRYHRIQFIQTNRKTDFSQIGEIWFEETGNYSWFDPTYTNRQQNSFNWPVINEARIDHELESRVRGARMSFAETFSGMDIDGAATLWEAMFREAPFCFSSLRPIKTAVAQVQEELWGVRLDSLTISETYNDDWNASRQISGILKTFDGDGKI